MTSLYYPEFEPPLGWLKAYLLFHDQIARIVPPDIDKLESAEFKRFRDSLPESIQDIPSTEDLIDLDDTGLRLLEKAFQKIAERMGDTRKFQVGYDPKTMSVSSPGFVFLHKSKVSNRVNVLLNRYGLAPQHLQFLATMSGPDFLFVNQEASNLVLSLLADRVARDSGLDSVTLRPLDYSLLALNGMGGTRFSGSVPGGHVDKLLAQAMISLKIPKAIADVSLEDYKEIRKEFIDLREPFDKLIKEQLSSQYLNDITDAGTLERRLKDTVTMFSTRLDEVGKRETLASLKYWTPFAVISLLGVAAAFPVSTPITVSLALITATVGIVDRIVSPPSTSDKNAKDIQRRLASLNDRLASQEISRMVSELR